MAKPRGETEPPPPPPPPPPLATRSSRSRFRPPSLDSRSLGRAPREPNWRTSLRLSIGTPARRRGALRELLGLPAGFEREDEQPPAGAAATSAAGGSGGLCLEPREHSWMLAAAEGRFEALQELLEAEPALLNRVDPVTGYSALHWLAKHGSHEGLILVHDFALSHGQSLDVSAPGSGGLTPLHLAAQQGHYMVIKVLVGALGADSSRRDHSGHRACHYLRPDAPPGLRELAGSEESEETQRAAAAPAGSVRRKGPSGNANNNCSISRNSWTALQPDWTDGGAPGGEKGSRMTQIQGFLRQLFSFFQDR